MKLSTRARYALRLMVDVCRNSNGGKPVQLREIAERAELSKGYLEHLATALRNASLLRGISGPKGGYLLAKPAPEIKVIEIIEAAIGPISIVGCATSPSACARIESCECNLLWKLLNSRIRGVLGEYSLEELTHESWRDTISKELTGTEVAGPKTSKRLWPCQQPAKG